MSNQTDIAKVSSPYYRNPVMFCSDVAAANRFEQDITNTEEWLAIVLHEYFHAFQLKHDNMMGFLADSLKTSADTLVQLYRKNEWFRDALQTENDLLLNAIATPGKDSTIHYLRIFIQRRQQRKRTFMQKLGYDISRMEDFWEKMEGPARYVEYNLAYIYQRTIFKDTTSSCDTFFNYYRAYKQPGLEKMGWMYNKTTIMSAYYYVTGFNMCRLLDKLDANYKKTLFDHNIPLSVLLENSMK